MNRVIGFLSASAAAGLPGLIVAAAMLLNMSAARAVDSFFAHEADTNPFCQLSGNISTDAFKLPELGGSYMWTTSGRFMEGSTVGKARLTGTITGGSPVSTFAVDLVVEGRLDDDPDPANLDDPYDDTCRSFLLRCGTADGWHVYTALSGTLTGLTGTFAGAVYSLSLRDPGSCDFGDPTNPVFQVGIGANTHNTDWGGFATLWFELADPVAFPSLPVGPIAGEVAIDITALNFPDSFPDPSPSLTGTWTGSIDCAGIADFTDTESFSGPVVLKVGEASGLNYGVELSDGNGVLKTYCAEYSNDLTVNSTQGTGRMIGDNSAEPPTTVYLKARNNPGSDATLKARELIALPDGPDVDPLPDGMNLCKWTFTQSSTAIPAGAPVGCASAVCGNGVVELLEQCDDGNTEDGDGCSAICTVVLLP